MTGRHSRPSRVRPATVALWAYRGLLIAVLAVTGWAWLLGMAGGLGR